MCLSLGNREEVNRLLFGESVDAKAALNVLHTGRGLSYLGRSWSEIVLRSLLWDRALR